MLGFDDYPDIAARLRSILAGEALHPHTPQDRRRLLPISPVDRDASGGARCPGHGLDRRHRRARARRAARAPYAAASPAARWRR